MAKYALALVALASAANAAPSETPEQKVTALVNTLCESSQHSEDVKPLFVADGTFVDTGLILDFARPATIALAKNIRAPRSVSVILDPARHGAWFQAIAEGSGKHPMNDCSHAAPAEHCDPYRQRYHIDGFAKEDHGDWKLELLATSLTEADQTLVRRGTFEGPKLEMSTTVERNGDPALGNAVIGWFAPGALAKSAVPRFALAAGSAAEELANGPGALAAKWDKMKMVMASVHAKVLADDFGVVTAQLRWALLDFTS